MRSGWRWRCDECGDHDDDGGDDRLDDRVNDDDDDHHHHHHHHHLDRPHHAHITLAPATPPHPHPLTVFTHSPS
eukprot:1536744-Rhodomonas_salina.1